MSTTTAHPSPITPADLRAMLAANAARLAALSAAVADLAARLDRAEARGKGRA